MSQRKSLAKEEAVAPSPLRRSSRLSSGASTPIPVTAVAGVITRRRSSASDAPPASVPAKLTRAKRSSLSQELSEDRPNTPNKQTRASSVNKSPKSESDAAGPVKRGRRGSISTIIEEETARPESLNTITRRRSLRGQSKSPTNDTVVTPKPRGRRASITEKIAPMESIDEVESKDSKVDMKKIGKSVIIPSTVKTIEEETDEAVNTKNQSTEDVKKSEEIINLEDEEVDKKEDEEVNKKKDEEMNIEEVDKNEDAKIKGKDEEIKNKDEEVKKKDDEKMKNKENEEINSKDVEINKKEDTEVPKIETTEENLTNGKTDEEMSPVHKISTQSSDDEDETDTKDEDTDKEEDSVFNSPKKTTSQPKSPKTSPRKESPKKESPKKQQSAIRKSLRLQKVSSPQDIELDLQVEVDPIEKLSPKVEIIPLNTNNKSPRKSLINADSPRLSRKSSSFSEDSTKTIQITPKRLSTSLIIANTENLDNSKTKSEEMSKQDETMHNKSINGGDVDEIKIKENNKELDESLGSNNSDKENLPVSPAVKPSPKPKSPRVSLMKTQSPKVSDTRRSLKNLSIEDIKQNCIEIHPVEISSKSPKLNESMKSVQDSFITDKDEKECESSPVKKMRDPIVSSELEYEDVFGSFVDEIIDDSENDAENEKIDADNKKHDIENEKDAENEKMDAKNEKDAKKEKESIVSEEKLEKPKGVKLVEEQKEVKLAEDSEEKKDPVVVSGKGSKRMRMSKTWESKIETLINQQLDEEESDDEDYEPKRDSFIDDEAFEGEEDTPSEDSNQIIEAGESLHSSDTEDLSDDDYDTDDSFVVDDDFDNELLSGEDYDLNILGEEPIIAKRRKSRIIQNTESDSSEEEEEEEKPVEIKPQEKSKRISDNVVKVLQEIVITTPTKTESPDKTKNLTKSPEKMIEVTKTPNNTLVESPPKGPRNSRRKSSITIQEQINVSSMKKEEIAEKVNKAVDFIVSSITDKGGNLKLNVSLDYANSPPSSTTEDTEETNEEDDKPVMSAISVKTDDKNAEAVDEDFKKLVEELVEDSSKKKKSRKNRKRNSLNQSTQDSLQSLNTSLETPKVAKKSKNSSASDYTDVSTSFEVLSDDMSDVQETISPRKKQKKLKKTIEEIPDLSELLGAKLSKQFSKTKDFKKSPLKHKLDSPIVPSKKLKKSEIVDQAASSPIVTSKIQRFPADLLLKVENVTAKPDLYPSNSKAIKKTKKGKTSGGNGQYANWQVSEESDVKPSTFMARRPSVKSQVEQVKSKLLPNDFRNQMLYRADIKRTDSKKIIKNKSKTSYNC